MKKQIIYSGSLDNLTHFATERQIINRRKIHSRGRFGRGIKTFSLLYVFVILRISKNVIIFRTKNDGYLIPPLPQSNGLLIPSGYLMFGTKVLFWR